MLSILSFHFSISFFLTVCLSLSLSLNLSRFSFQQYPPTDITGQLNLSDPSVSTVVWDTKRERGCSSQTRLRANFSSRGHSNQLISFCTFIARWEDWNLSGRWSLGSSGKYMHWHESAHQVFINWCSFNGVTIRFGFFLSILFVLVGIVNFIAFIECCVSQNLLIENKHFYNYYYFFITSIRVLAFVGWL